MRRNSKDGFGLPQILVGTLATAAMALVVMKLAGVSASLSQRSKASTAISSLQLLVAGANQDIPSWLQEMRGNANTSWTTTCLPAPPTSPTACPAADTPAVTDPYLVNLKQTSSQIISSVPVVTNTGLLIAGDAAHPVLYGPNGAQLASCCSQTPIPSTCNGCTIRHKATGYFIHDPGTNPGSVNIAIKFESVGLSTPTAPAYVTIPVLTAWTAAATCTQGIQSGSVCYKFTQCSGGMPYFQGWSSSGTVQCAATPNYPFTNFTCPAGQYMIGFKSDGTPDCR